MYSTTSFPRETGLFFPFDEGSKEEVTEGDVVDVAGTIDEDVDPGVGGGREERIVKTIRQKFLSKLPVNFTAKNTEFSDFAFGTLFLARCMQIDDTQWQVVTRGEEKWTISSLVTRNLGMSQWIS